MREGRPYFLYFFFQAEDGIRDLTVTGVQTCALPIWRFVERFLHDLLACESARARLRGEDQPMREHGDGDRLHVVGLQEAAAVRERTGLGDAQERDSRARARAEVEARIAAGRAQQRDDIAVEALLDEDALRFVR